MFNSVVLVGRAGQDPKVRYFESGKVQTTFNLAVSRPKKKEEKGETDWFRIELWGRSAEIAGEYVKKGKLVGIEGSLRENKWTDDQGQERNYPFIAANTMQLLGGKQESYSPDVKEGELPEEDELPF